MKRMLIPLIGWITAAVTLAAEPQVLKKWEFHSAADAAGWKIGRDLKDLEVSGNQLAMTLTGSDAYIFLPPVDVPLDGCRLRVRLLCDRGGITEVFWRTANQQEFTQLQSQRESNPADKPATLEYRIGTLADAGKRLVGLRIDPCNGNAAGRVEIESVELLRDAAVLDVNCAFSSAQVDLGEEVASRVMVRQTDGGLRTEPVSVEWADTEQEELRLAPATRPAGESATVMRFDRPGVHRSSVAVHTGEKDYEMESSIIVGKRAELPLQPALRSETTRLDLIPSWDGQGVGAARWQVKDNQGEWRQCGWLLPLAELAVQDHGKISRLQPVMTVYRKTESELELQATAGNWKIRTRLTLATITGRERVLIHSELHGPAGGELLAFSGPVLRVERDPTGDPLDRCGIFGGLEFLEPGWRSSSDRAVGPKFADRWSPDPFKVTLPMMAIEAGGVTTALMWHGVQPLRFTGPRIPPDDPDKLPVATFASPNFLDGQDNHLMKLSLPSIPKFRHENESLARTPLVLAGKPVSLTCFLYAECALPVVQACRRWYEVFGPATAPPMPEDDKTSYDLIARNFGETMYWPEEKGWTFHWFFPEKPRYSGAMAGELIAHALTTGKRQYVEATGQAGRSIIEAVGPIAPQIPNAAHARAQITAMRTDGTFAFHNTEHMRKQCLEWTHGQFDSLGAENSTSLGTCVQAALPIIRRAALTGEPEFITASVRALEAMSRFRVPRGAQVWEVHQEIPDIRAAALAVEAFRLGYEMTGEQRWLDQASYWAWTGAPFVYSWHVPIEGKPLTVMISRDRAKSDFTLLPAAECFEKPQRQVTPFGIIPVLGPTFYVHNWFGVLVQWCGLEWAEKVIELDRLRPDPLLRSIATGVVASGFQQTLDKAPWVGLYPDSWDLRANRAQPAYISASLPLQCLQAAGRAPAWARTWTRIVRDDTGKRQWHVTGWGRPVSIPPPQLGTWTAMVRFLPKQPNELIIANIDAPQHVWIGSDALPHQDKPQPAAMRTSGWWYWPDQRGLVAHFTQPEEQTKVRIEW